MSPRGCNRFNWYFTLLYFSHLYNKTRHSYFICMSPIAGQTAWTEWGEFFCGHSRVAEKCLRITKKSNFFSFSNFDFFHGQCRALQLVIFIKNVLSIRMFYFIFIDKPKNTFIELGNRKCEDFLHTSIMCTEI